ncbi:MAG TPA: response regulator transcription factor, partial [Rhodothermales bacterium]|nr:response regulator transcription factor [Rhodothermales bacterium]
PEILILDLGLPGMNGFDVLRQVRRLSPDPKVIVLSMHGDAEYVVQAFRDGAAAYVLKGSAAGDLLEALKVVRRGETYLGRGLPPSILKSSDLQEDLSDQDRYSTLTHREREVMQFIAEGLTSQEIGERLFISRRTVDKHRERIMSKLDLKNQTEIVRFALRRGLVRDPESSSSPEFE